MEPKAHVRRAGTFRPDFVAQIFDRDPRSLQVFECLSQYCHARQVKRHVSDRFRRWFSFKQSDRHVLVPNCDTILIFEFNGQAERTLEPLRAAFWTGNRQSEMADCPQRERNFLTRVTAPRRDWLSAHRPARSRPALPGHQPTLRTRFYRPYLQQSLQTMGYHLQRR